MNKTYLLMGTILIFIFAVASISGCSVPVESFEINGLSMEPTYPKGTSITTVATELVDLERGDVLVVEYPYDTSRTFVKRLIGFPGETVEIIDGNILIDGTLFTEPYPTIPNPEFSGLYELGDDEYFVVGDNRPNSSDSRQWGPVNGVHIRGRVTFVR